MTGAELQQIRHQLGLSQAKLAKRLGVQVNTVYRWEAGINGVSNPEILRLALNWIEHEMGQGAAADR